MTLVEIVVGILLGLAVNEFTSVSPWAARKIVRWSARFQYGETDLGSIREEELEALIDRRPGKLSKLATASWFATAALFSRIRQAFWGEDSAPSQGALESIPSLLVAPYMFPTERFRGEWRRHPVNLMKSLLFGVSYAALAIWATVLRIKPQFIAYFVIGIVLYTAIWSLTRILQWRAGRFVITNKRLLSAEGLINRQVAMIPLARVTDLRYQQSALGRIFDYGTFYLESAGRENALRKIKDLPNPDGLYLRLVEEIYEPAAVEARLGDRLDDSQFDEFDWAQEDEFQPTPKDGTVQDIVVQDTVVQIRSLIDRLEILAASIAEIKKPDEETGH